MTDPIAPVISVQIVRCAINGKVRIVTVECPHCGRLHTHGWPLEDGDQSPGHRVSDCLVGRGYYIATPEEAAAP